MQFLEYMLRSGRLQPVSCRKYAGALYGTLSRMAEMPLSEIESAHEFEQIAEGLRQLDAFSQLKRAPSRLKLKKGRALRGPHAFCRLNSPGFVYAR